MNLASQASKHPEPASPQRPKTWVAQLVQLYQPSDTGPRPLRLFPVVLLAVLASSGAAHAESSETDRSVAQSLFEQARRLMDAGKYDEACPKFAESQRLDPGGGTLLNLGLCHEKQGKLASAWSDFKEALSVARRDGRSERARAAEERVTELEAKLPWLTLSVSATVPNQVVTLDGAAIGRAGWGTPMAVDPGSHELRVTAPGYQPWTQQLSLTEAQKMTIALPKLQEVKGSATPEAATIPNAEQDTKGGAEASSEVDSHAVAPPREAGSNTAAWVIGGAGVAAIGVGSYFGLQAFSKRHKSDGACQTDTTCTADGVTWNKQAETAAWIADFGIGLGLVGVATGAYLLLKGTGSAPETAHHDSAWTLTANASRTGGSVGVGGRW